MWKSTRPSQTHHIETASNPLFRLLDSSGKASEDATSGALATRLSESPDLLRLFVKFLFHPRDVPARLLRRDFTVYNQYRFSVETQKRAHVGSRGKIDLALIDRQNGDFVGVEYKVRDCEKPGRLHNYRLLMEADGFSNTWLFEILQRREHDIGGMDFLDGIQTWNELDKFLKTSAGELNLFADRHWVAHYGEFLARSGTLVPDGREVRKLRSKQNPPRSDQIYSGILSNLTDIVGGVRTEKNLPLHLRLGRKSWAARFPGTWHERIWMYARNPPGSQRVYVIFSIIFYHAAYTTFEYAERRLPDWGEKATAAGMVVWRGPEKGWDGKKRVQLTRPWHLDCKPKYFYAEEREPALMADALDLSNGCDALVTQAVSRFERYAAVVETFRS